VRPRHVRQQDLDQRADAQQPERHLAGRRDDQPGRVQPRVAARQLLAPFGAAAGRRRERDLVGLVRFVSAVVVVGLGRHEVDVGGLPVAQSERVEDDHDLALAVLQFSLQHDLVLLGGPFTVDVEPDDPLPAGPLGLDLEPVPLMVERPPAAGACPSAVHPFRLPGGGAGTMRPMRYGR
jgi:hypothetical protein